MQSMPQRPSKAAAGPIAQRLEQATHNRLVTGSNPVGPTILKISNLKAILLDSRCLIHANLFWGIFIVRSLSCFSGSERGSQSPRRSRLRQRRTVERVAAFTRGDRRIRSNRAIDGIIAIPAMVMKLAFSTRGGRNLDRETRPLIGNVCFET